MFNVSPGPCPICGAAHSACKPAGDPGGDGVGVTRGVIVRSRDDGRIVLPASRLGGAVQTSAQPTTRPVAGESLLDARRRPERG
jgi:hypothetical protein